MGDTNEKDINNEEILSQNDIDVMGEIANISFGSASTVLSTILNQPVSLTAPQVEVVNVYDASDVDIPHVVLKVGYHEALDMENLLVLKREVAVAIADLMMMGTGDVDPERELTELELSAVQEAMNQMMGNAATSMSQLFHDVVDISPPSINVVTLKDEVENITPGARQVVKISFDMQVGDAIHSKLVQIVPIEGAKKMVNKLLGISEIVEETEVMDEVEELSQQEIQSIEEGDPKTKETLSQNDMDVIGEIANISFGSASTVLSTLLNKQVTITTPYVEVADVYDASDVDIPHVVLRVAYHEGLEMENLFVLKQSVAAAIADLMMMGTGEINPEKELTELELSAVQEAMNQMMGNAATSMSQMFDDAVDISPPSIKVIALKDEVENLTPQARKVVKISFDMQMGDSIHSKLVQIIPIDGAKGMVNKLLGINAMDKNLIEATKETENALSPQEVDMMGELCNISIGSASTIMSALLSKQVRIGTADVEVVSLSAIEPKDVENFVLNVDFKKGISASNTILLTKEATLIMADLMMMGTGEGIDTDKEITDFELSAMQEMMNQMMGNAATAMSSMFKEPVDITPPTYGVMKVEDMLNQIRAEKSVEQLVRISFALDVEDVIHTKITQFFLLSEAKALSNRLLGLVNTGGEKAESEKVEQKKAPEKAAQPPKPKEQAKPTKQAEPVEPIETPNETQPSARAAGDEIINGVEVNVMFVFGSHSATLEDFLSYEEHEIIEMSEAINDPIKMVVNGVIVGYGELVNVNGHFGVKVLEVS